MFGTRPYSKFFELCIPESLYTEWFDCFVDHELSLSSAKSGDYMHFSSKTNSPADSASIQKGKTVRASGEWLLGEPFPYNQELATLIKNSNQKNPIALIKELKDLNLIPDSGLHNGLINTIEEMVGEGSRDLKMLLEANGDLLNISNFADSDDQTVTRARGGYIATIIRGRSEYDRANHIIAPVQSDAGLIRFHYKNQQGKSIIKHINSKS